MVETLRLIASRYSTTIAEDEILLAQDSLTRRQRMAVRVRLGEKKLLQEAFDHFSEMVAEEAADTASATTKKAKRSE